MNKIDYQALREAAEKAGEDKWQAKKINGDFFVIRHGSYTRQHGYTSYQPIAEIDCKPVRDFVAKANPATVLALLDERERNQQYIKRRDQENEEIALTVGKLRVELEAAENNLIDSECHVAELEEALRDKQALLEASEKRNAKLQSENAYIRNRYKELDLLIGKNILVMQAAIIEWQATGDAKSGLAWIYNTLFGPGELPDESEKDAQAYFNRKYAPIDEKLMALHKWFWEQSEAERAAGIRIKGGE
ncbi:ead/Ea22-like family protein [Escherichia coli]|nr:ead/Ea22-like family protein [Escherichia coli]EGO9765103.1 ead/Ea22-like family protein [Escherichia coli]EJE4743320.1 ead/Ea22-like family protein [Escherichia coli]ELF7790347.1 ead/Ea22-like family protein [Escherichia coli]